MQPGSKVCVFFGKTLGRVSAELPLDHLSKSMVAVYAEDPNCQDVANLTEGAAPEPTAGEHTQTA